MVRSFVSGSHQCPYLQVIAVFATPAAYCMIMPIPPCVKSTYPV